MNWSTVIEDLGILRSNDLPVPALVLVDDREGLLQRRADVAEEMRLGEARPAVQEDQRRVGEPLARIITH